MESEALQFIASLLAVSALVALTWLLGFRQEARLTSEAEARELIRLAPGGFEPIRMAIDQQGRSAIARDAAGRLLVLLPHGNQFVAQLLGPMDRLEARDDQLLVTLAHRRFALTLGEPTPDWLVDRAPAS